MPFANLLVIREPSQNRSILIETMRPELDTDTCDTIATQSREKTNHFWLVMWNRTGVVHYEEHAIDWRQSHKFQIELPETDPPFLVWPGMTCFQDARVQFHAKDWLVTSSSLRHSEENDGPDRMMQRTEPDLDVVVQVAQGERVGEATLDIAGNLVFIELGPKHGTVERPSSVSLGHIYLYAPSTPQGSDRWQRHIWWNASELDGTWRIGYGQVAESGAWKIVVELEAPAVNETAWTVGFDSVWEFIPERVEGLGFELPFSNYVDQP